MAQPNYPECEKLAGVSHKSQAIGAFLEWLQTVKHFEFAEWRKTEDTVFTDDVLILVHYTIESLLAEYFEIDMNKVKEERQQILEDIRSKETNPKPS